MAGRLPAVVIDNGTGYAIRFICFPLNSKQEMHTSRIEALSNEHVIMMYNPTGNLARCFTSAYFLLLDLVYSFGRSLGCLIGDSFWE
uniref:Uncharacterized protein n=1 Tax=Magallana gigas TaxID=29159 RepID=K1RTE6_MAGGI